MPQNWDSVWDKHRQDRPQILWAPPRLGALGVPVPTPQTLYPPSHGCWGSLTHHAPPVHRCWVSLCPLNPPVLPKL